MKVFLLIVLAAAACVLGYLWLESGRKAEREKLTFQARITELSDVAAVKDTRLEEVQAAKIRLEQDVANLEQQLEIASIALVAATNQVTTLQSQVAEATEAARRAEVEIAERDQRIAGLEVERDGLTAKMNGLDEEIVRLEKKITDTEAQLAAARGDRSFLLRELTRMQAEKAELERQFTDLAVLREQVNRLQNELAVARRVDLIRSGRYGGQQMKGAQLLRSKQFKAEPEVVPQSFDLDVELKADGSVPAVNTNRASIEVTPLDP